MLLGVGFKVILISTVVLGFLVPARAKLLARVGSRAVAGTGHFSRHPVIGLLQPFAQFLDSITRDSRTEEDKKRWATSAAPLLVLIAPLAAFAVVPFGSRYVFDGALVSLVVADIEWGVVWLVGAAMLAIYGSSALIVDPDVRCALLGLIGTGTLVHEGDWEHNMEKTPFKIDDEFYDALHAELGIAEVDD